MKIHPVGAELFHVDGGTNRQTDMMKLKVHFSVLQTQLKMGLKKLRREGMDWIYWLSAAAGGFFLLR